jgi:phytanoyl-CoA hydroxylase
MNIFEMPDFYFSDAITQEQQEFFDKYGIIQFKKFIDPVTVSLLLKETENVQNHLLINDVKKVNGIPLKFGEDVDGSRLIQRIAFTSFYSKKLSEFLKNKKLENLLTLMGPYEGRIGEAEKDGLVFNHYVNTAESKFTQLGWHTDSPRDLFLGSRILPMLNIGLHLDNCHSSTGGLRVIPGTHQQGLLSMLFRKKYFIDHKADKKKSGLILKPATSPFMMAAYGIVCNNQVSQAKQAADEYFIFRPSLAHIIQKMKPALLRFIINWRK